MKTNSAKRNLSSLFLRKKVEVKLTHEILMLMDHLLIFQTLHVLCLQKSDALPKILNSESFNGRKTDQKIVASHEATRIDNFSLQLIRTPGKTHVNCLRRCFITKPWKSFKTHG